MRFLLALVLLVLSSGHAQALTAQTAQHCAQELLSAYNQKTYPTHLLNANTIIRRAFGPVFRRFSSTQKAVALQVGTELLRASFEEQTGRYQYQNVTVSRIAATSRGFRITGEVHITSPKYTGTVEYMVLTGSGCDIYQARLANLYSLDSSLRNELKHHPSTRSWLND